MRKLLRARREGFSLIELLIVVAIIAALVGVAVPFFQDNLSEAQRTKAGQDLEVIKKAIALYDARESRPITGTDLAPLLGRYMQELPKDPWGNDYLFDGVSGLLASYGADALPEGSGGDTDIVVYTRPPLMINRVQYQGSWGRPKAVDTSNFSRGNKFIVTLTKPCSIDSADNATDEVVLLRNIQNPVEGQNGDSIPLGGDFGTGTIAFEADGASTAGTPVNDPLNRPEVGVLVFHCVTSQTDPSDQTVTPTMAIDFADTNASERNDSGATSVGTAIAETWAGEALAGAAASPLDPSVYGSAVDQSGGTRLYWRDPQPAEYVAGKRRGIRIEKY